MRKLLLSLGLLLVVALSLRGVEQANELARTQQESVANQTAAISTITLASPTVNTGYLVTSHIAVHGTNGGNTCVTPMLDYTDVNGFSHNASGGGCVQSDNNSDGPLFIYAKGGTNVTFATGYSGGTDNASYDVVVSLYQQP